MFCTFGFLDRTERMYEGIDFLSNFTDLHFPSPKRQRLNCWSPPPEGVLKFNVDVFAHGAPGRSKIGGIVRNSKRQHVGIFSKALGVLWAYEAEVKALLHALIFCQEFHLHHVLIESDSSLTVGWVNSKVNGPWKLLQDLNLIDLLCVEVDCIGVRHIFMESNTIADYLAKSGCNRERHIWSML